MVEPTKTTLAAEQQGVSPEEIAEAEKQAAIRRMEQSVPTPTQAEIDAAALRSAGGEGRSQPALTPEARAQLEAHHAAHQAQTRHDEAHAPGATGATGATGVKTKTMEGSGAAPYQTRAAKPGEKE